MNNLRKPSGDSDSDDQVIRDRLRLICHLSDCLSAVFRHQRSEGDVTEVSYPLKLGLTSELHEAFSRDSGKNQLRVFSSTRRELSAHQQDDLQVLARSIFENVELRSRNSVMADSEFVNTVLNNLPVALFCKDAKSGYTYNLWNSMSEKLFGLSQSNTLGKSDHEIFPADQADFFRSKDIETMKNLTRIEIAEEPVDSHTLGRRWLHTIKVPIADVEGNPRFLLGISQDITVRREQETLIQNQQAKIIAGAKMSSLGEMAGGIAHEINNPLAIIHARAVQLQDMLSDGRADPARLKDGLLRVEQTAERIAKIIRGLRNFSRDGDRDPFVDTSVAQLLEESSELFRERFKNHGIQLRIHPVPDAVVPCRAVQICQVLVNLLGNAHDAVRGFGGAWVEIGATVIDDHLRITVTDSGSGIPTEIREKILEPFFTTKPIGEGTGLGLSIAKGIIEDHHGTFGIDVEHPNTRFFLTLPLKQASRRAA